jgi:hypothetical protein
LFAFNKASSRAKLSARGCETPPLNKNPTERKYTFSLAASMARITLLEHWPLISDFSTFIVKADLNCARLTA